MSSGSFTKSTKVETMCCFKHPYPGGEKGLCPTYLGEPLSRTVFSREGVRDPNEYLMDFVCQLHNIVIQ
jgi:hypothetical protein